MEQNGKCPIRKAVWIPAALIALAAAVILPVFAWFYRSELLAYAPISSHEALYIGAGHIEIADGEFADATLEDVRYLYLEGVDLTDEDRDYFDYVFCVYGMTVSGFKLQLAFTTNNPFSYEIFDATEANAPSPGSVAYTTHGATPATYYYTATGDAIAGSLLNLDEAVSDEETVALTDTSENSRHTTTYGSYNNVNKYGEPLYWQTDSSILTGVAKGAFAKYFILRIYKDGKEINDRETDVICIAAKSST